MRKAKLIVMISVIFLALLLISQMSIKVFAQLPIVEITTQKYFNETLSQEIEGKMLELKTTFTIERTEWLNFLGISMFIQLNGRGWVEVNGTRVMFYFNTTKYPTSKLYVSSETKNLFYSSTSSSPVRYSWDGITFISTKSSPLHVEYDHPDNGPYSNPTYNIHPNESKSSILKGNVKRHVHLPVWLLKDTKSCGTLWSLVGAILSVAGILLMIPAGVPQIIGAVIAVIGGILAILGLTIQLFVEEVLETELSDGWTWIWGQGKWWKFVWWWQSFGRWRDWEWFFLLGLFWGGGGSGFSRLR